MGSNENNTPADLNQTQTPLTGIRLNNQNRPITGNTKTIIGNTNIDPPMETNVGGGSNSTRGVNFTTPALSITDRLSQLSTIESQQITALITNRNDDPDVPNILRLGQNFLREAFTPASKKHGELEQFTWAAVQKLPVRDLIDSLRDTYLDDPRLSERDI